MSLGMGGEDISREIVKHMQSEFRREEILGDKKYK